MLKTEDREIVQLTVKLSLRNKAHYAKDHERVLGTFFTQHLAPGYQKMGIKLTAL